MPRNKARTRICTALSVGILLTVVACGGRSATVQADLRPVPSQNVLLITIDTLRADALGCYGGPASTPALDRLAGEGVRFDFAHAHAVLTLSSHASILTGQYPFQHGLRDNSGYRLPPDARTLATMLKHAGYATAAFVAAFPVHSRFGLGNGFDVYDDKFGETRAPTEFAMPERPASVVVPLARSWIAARRGTGRPDPPDLPGQSSHPWFAWVHVFDPHAPYRPPPPFDTQYASQPYYGEVAAVDAALGPLLDDVRGASRPTIVIVTGDHGEALGEHGEASHGLFAYEPTLRVPLIVAELGPQRTGGPGEVSSVSVSHVDIVPTILDAIGQPVPQDLPGRSVLGAAQRRARASRPVYFEAMSAMLNRGWAPLTGVIVDREKYIDLPIAERYDLAVDPREQTNVAGRARDRDAALVDALRSDHATLPGQRVREDPRAAARLRALGYVSDSAPTKTRYTDADDPKRLVELDQMIHDAVDAFTAGRAADAVRIYQQAIERRPDMSLAYRHLAFVEWQRGNPAAAIDTLHRALMRGVGDPRVVTQLGGYLTDTNRAADAIRILEPAASDPSADADLLNTLGIAYARAGRGDKARAAFERVLTINPESSVPIENLGVLALERGDVEQARAYFDRAVRAAPASSRAHAGVGNAAMRAGDHASAIEAWTRAVQLDPTNFDALYNLGLNLARDGRMAEARPYLQQFLDRAPDALYAQDRRAVASLLAHPPK